MTYGPLKQQMLPLVRRGLSNAALIEAFSQRSANTVRVMAHKLRAEIGVRPANAASKPLYLSQDLLRALKTEAVAREGAADATAQDLALRLLAIIVRDDLFDAILDDGR